MKKLLQTKEAIKNLMIEKFQSILPEIKHLANYPIIATNIKENPSPPSLYWLWLLPSKSVITYGEDGKNLFVLYPEYKQPIIAANNGMCCTIEILTNHANNSPKSIPVTILTVEHLIYSHECYNEEDSVIIVSPSTDDQTNIYNLFYQEIECNYPKQKKHS